MNNSTLYDVSEPKRKIFLETKDVSLKYLSLLASSLRKEEIYLEIGTDPSSCISRFNDFFYHKSEKYVARLNFSNTSVSHILVQRQIRIPFESIKRLNEYLKEEHCFWNDLHLKSLPVVTFQFTEKDFRGLGLNTFLIAVANEQYYRLFGIPLYSHVEFANMEDKRNGTKEIKKGSKRVWEKLEERNLAERIKWQNLDRWRCKTYS